MGAIDRSFSCVFLVLVVVCGFVLCYGVQVGVVYASTDVVGIISSDTAWTQAGSPYNLTGNVLVDSDVTLTIEAGVTVNTGDYYLRVDGTLIIQQGVTLNLEKMLYDGVIQVNGVLTARGTSTNPIHVNGVGYAQALGAPPEYSPIVFSGSSVAWNEQAGSGCIIENTVFSQSEVTISGSPKITNCTFIDNSELNLDKGSPTITNNEIHCIVSVTGGSPIISHNNLENGGIGFTGGDFVSIFANVFSGGTEMARSRTCIWIGGRDFDEHVLIERNSITHTYYGIYIFDTNIGGTIRTSLTIQNNSITNNYCGIHIKDPCFPTIYYNDICNNTINLELSSDASQDINATHNWWGTTDTQTISDLIIDFNDNLFDLGKVTFTPFLTEPNPNAMPIPEFPTWIILPLVLALSLVIAVFRKRNKSLN
jgi:hypothetical protein